MTHEEKIANERIQALGAKLKGENYDPVIHKFYEQKKVLESSKLFEALNAMPKGGIHHLHLTAAAPIDFLIKLTYEDIVYYNDREHMFKACPHGPPEEEGFIKVNDLRQHHESVEEFDNMLKQKILLTQDIIDSQESH